MFVKIKNKIEIELKNYIRDVDRLHFLKKTSPLLYRNIKNFVSRKGKRVRPILFVIGYLGFAKKAAPLLYRSAVSLELLHDFMLVHDDIIDKSDTRRGRPSMHMAFNKFLGRHKNVKFSGQDLAIVAGDIMYAMALDAFLSIKEDLLRKEKALRKLIQAAFYTASGEFAELMYGIRKLGGLTKKDIYKIYDLKTANYTFASPLSIGAILAGAKISQTQKIFTYGTYLGRAFQIKDDILGIFGADRKTGKSNLTDLKEAKRTILVWYAYHHSNKTNKRLLKRILSKAKVDKTDLSLIRRIITAAGALDYAKREIQLLLVKASVVAKTLSLAAAYKEMLNGFSAQLLKI